MSASHARAFLCCLAGIGLACRAAHGVELTVQDPSGCVEPDSVQAALDAVVGAAPLEVVVQVLPDGERRGVTIEWVDLDRRELDVAAGDCPRLGVTLALATERMLARLPSDLRPRPAVWEHGLGIGAGAGLWPTAPWVSLWTDHALRSDVGLALGPTVGFTTQPAGEGRVLSLAAGLRAGVRVRVGEARLEGGGFAQGVVGQGVGLFASRTRLRPRFGVRAALSGGRRVRTGLGAELAIGRPTWTVDGAASTPHPLVLVVAELGWMSGDR